MDGHQGEQIVVEPTYKSSNHKSYHVQVSSSANQQQESVPTRWRTIRDSQLDIHNEQTNLESNGNYLETKHEESRRRAGMSEMKPNDIDE